MDVVSTVKEAINIAQQIKNVELQSKLLDVQSELNSQKEEILRLREENLRLQESQKQREELKFDPERRSYWKDAGDGEEQGPFCPNCYDALGKSMRMIGSGNNKSWFKCPQCMTVSMWGKGEQIII